MSEVIKKNTNELDYRDETEAAERERRIETTQSRRDAARRGAQVLKTPGGAEAMQAILAQGGHKLAETVAAAAKTDKLSRDLGIDYTGRQLDSSSYEDTWKTAELDTRGKQANKQIEAQAIGRKNEKYTAQETLKSKTGDIITERKLVQPEDENDTHKVITKRTNKDGEVIMETVSNNPNYVAKLQERITGKLAGAASKDIETIGKKVDAINDARDEINAILDK